jgi:Tripartite tricarboxylate transporter TctB family
MLMQDAPLEHTCGDAPTAPFAMRSVAGQRKFELAVPARPSNNEKKPYWGKVMALRVKSSQDFWTGLAFVVFGATTAILSTEYPIGTTSRMGPGYFPLALGILLALLGIIIVARAMTDESGGNVGRVDLWLALRLLVAVVAFGTLLNPLGLLATSFVTVLVAAWAGPEFKIIEGIVTGVVLSLASWLIFVFGLKQTIPVWPSFV